jgi:hypothetical protein
VIIKLKAYHLKEKRKIKKKKTKEDLENRKENKIMNIYHG